MRPCHVGGIRALVASLMGLPATVFGFDSPIDLCRGVSMIDERAATRADANRSVGRRCVDDETKMEQFAMGEGQPAIHISLLRHYEWNVRKPLAEASRGRKQGNARLVPRAQLSWRGGVW